MDDHVGLEGLLLDEGLEADVTLEWPYAGVDQHVPLQVGRKGELSGTHLALEFFHTLEKKHKWDPLLIYRTIIHRETFVMSQGFQWLCQAR